MIFSLIIASIIAAVALFVIYFIALSFLSAFKSTGAKLLNRISPSALFNKVEIYKLDKRFLRAQSSVTSIARGGSVNQALRDIFDATLIDKAISNAELASKVEQQHNKLLVEIVRFSEQVNHRLPELSDIEKIFDSFNNYTIEYQETYLAHSKLRNKLSTKRKDHIPEWVDVEFKKKLSSLEEKLKKLKSELVNSFKSIQERLKDDKRVRAVH
jgi:hypothetical protein